MSNSEPTRRFGRLVRFLEDGDSDRSIAEAIGIAVAVLYVPLAVVSLVAGFWHAVYYGLSGASGAFGAGLEAQITLLTTWNLWGLSPVFAGLYGVALYHVLTRRRAIILGWLAFTTLASFAFYQQGPFIDDVAVVDGTDALVRSLGITWPILVVPFAFSLPSSVVSRLTVPDTDQTVATDGGDAGGDDDVE